MLRSLSLLVCGALLGGGLTLLVAGDSEHASAPGSTSPSLRENMASLAAGRDRARIVETVTVSETLAVYNAAATETDITRLAAALERIAAEPWSPATDVEIDALLASLSDLNPAFAATRVRELDLDMPFVADVFVNWARTDPEAAISELARIGSRAERLEVALALLDVFGDDASGRERVAAGLPGEERSLLIVESIVSRAEYEPYAAFRDALALNEIELRRRALTEIGAVWAAQDARGAIAQAEQLPEQLQSTFRAGVIHEWARLDSTDYLAWLSSVASPPVEAAVGIDLLAQAHFDQLMSIADTMTPDQGQRIRFSAFAALAETDPDEAMARAEAMLPGSDRDMLLMSVGSTVARSDPEAAFAWARRMTPPSRNLMTQITVAIVQNDPERAIAFLENPPEGVDSQLITAVLGSTLGRDPEQAEEFADRLAASDSIQAANALRNVVSRWIQQDPERAFDWALANDAALDSAIIGPVAQAMARADPAVAASYIGRIPDEHRPVWITQVAGPYALQNPDAALAWVTQFQGQDFYDGALRQVISASAWTDARAAARVLSQSSVEVQLGAASQVAQAWAQEDPRAAARWAASLSEPRARSGAIVASIGQWAGRDLGAARNFALGLERGETRDQALSAVISTMSQSGEFDRELLGSYSSDTARQDALVRAIPVIAQSDREQADELLGLVTSANTRRQIEDRIAAFQAL